MSRSLSRSSPLALVGVLATLASTQLLACSSDDTGSGGSPGTGASGAAGPTSNSVTSSSSESSTTSSSSAGGAGGGTGGATTGGGGVGTNVGGGGSNAGGGGSSTGGAGGSAGGNGGTGGVAPVDDADGDGWTIADGDCCDSTADGCAEPALVNPGAFEYLGNGVDDDCDPNTDDLTPVPDCGGNPLDVPTSSIELIKAMDLCQFTTESPPLPDKKWGVISTFLLRADGTAVAPNDLQVGVLADYGTNVAPKKGATMAALSSGTARDETDPGYVHPQNGVMPNQNTGNFNAMTQSGVPPTWLAANGGALPPAANCPACVGPNCLTAYDSANLKARIRVPTNAKGFSYNFKFYSAEFPEFLCQQYNDFFVTLLDSQNPQFLMQAPDGNIAFDAAGNPVSVNNGFFQVCFPTPSATCPAGTLELVGTGMGGWAGNLKDGGGTLWLTNDAPVNPGETIEIQFIIWDAADHNVDSAVLLDKFRWNITPSPVGTHT